MTNISVITSKRRLVLFVDDEVSLQKQVTAYLSSRGLEVQAVSDGDTALLSLRERRPDLVCVNVNLPRMSGYEVCEQIRADRELDGVIVLMTNERISLEACAHSYEAGANAYLNKPYTMDQLGRAVERLLGSAPDDEAELSVKLA
jgi:DNA-binding response OmpR family regulator